MNVDHMNGVTIHMSSETGGLTLAELFAGRSGIVNLRGDIFLWEEGAAPAGADMICKLKSTDNFSEKFERFKQAAVGHFLPVWVAWFDEEDDELIKEARKYFHTVLVPCEKRPNIPADFRAHVLGYTS